MPATQGRPVEGAGAGDTTREDAFCGLLVLDKQREARAVCSESLAAYVLAQQPPSLPEVVCNVALALIRDEPLQVARYRSRRMEAQVDRAIVQFKPDVVVVQLSRLFPLVERIASRSSIPIVVDMVDALSLSAANRASKYALWDPRRLVWLREAATLRRVESRTICIASAVTVVSKRDHMALGGSKKVTVVPNGVRLDEARQPSWERLVTSEPRLLFHGNMSYQPNVDAAMYLAQEVLPIVRRSFPRATCTIVGANPDRRIRSLSREFVTVTGTVDEVRPYLQSSDVGVYPILTGAGMQNKVLEAMAAGLPVVTTPFVLEGVPVQPGTQVLVGATAPEIARQVVRILGSRELSARLSLSGRMHVQASFGWLSSVDTLDRLLQAVVSAKKQEAWG